MKKLLLSVAFMLVYVTGAKSNSCPDQETLRKVVTQNLEQIQEGRSQIIINFEYQSKPYQAFRFSLPRPMMKKDDEPSVAEKKRVLAAIGPNSQFSCAQQSSHLWKVYFQSEEIEMPLKKHRYTMAFEIKEQD